MKTTFITTVLNEEISIEELILSLQKQSIKPNEIIIVDAGSKDKTRDIIKKYKKIKLFTKKGNRSVGRNFAIKKAKNNIIIVSDAGCILDKNFIRNITKPFLNRNFDVVSGFYYPVTNNIFEKCLSTYTCTMVDKIDELNFLPSSRSIAFRKNAWEEIGGYPEFLDTCEDLIFAIDLKKNHARFKFRKNAFVHWRQQKDIFTAWIQFFTYAKGDGKAFYIRPQTPFLFFRYFLIFILSGFFIVNRSSALLVLILFIVFSYIQWSIFKNYKYVKKLQALIFLPILQISADTAVITGMCIGVIDRISKKENEN